MQLCLQLELIFYRWLKLKVRVKKFVIRLIGAIKGFPKDIAHYKRSDEWGEAVIQYLSK